MNIDRIIQTNIPDIAPVYGGVRGRTMSSRHQSYAWPALVEAGVKRVIDLRDVDSSNKLPFLCDKYGMEYFHYPVNNHAKQVESMVNLMPQFCEMIDKGDFYIACAMGLHRTDIALCTYWVFYAADKGIAPPPIRGYRQEEGHDTSKIMYVLNSIYKYMTEQNGVEPIPMETFKERKKVINENSKEKSRNIETEIVPHLFIQRNMYPQYHQRDIIEYNVKLNDGRWLPVRGVVISNDDINYYRVTICRISMEMSVFNSLYHFPLTDDMFVHPLEEPCYLTTGFENLENPEERISKRLNIMNENAFEKYLVWLTSQVGHKFLRSVESH